MIPPEAMEFGMAVAMEVDSTVQKAEIVVQEIVADVNKMATSPDMERKANNAWDGAANATNEWSRQAKAEWEREWEPRWNESRDHWNTRSEQMWKEWGNTAFNDSRQAMGEWEGKTRDWTVNYTDDLNRTWGDVRGRWEREWEPAMENRTDQWENTTDQWFKGSRAEWENRTEDWETRSEDWANRTFGAAPAWINMAYVNAVPQNESSSAFWWLMVALFVMVAAAYKLIKMRNGKAEAALGQPLIQGEFVKIGEENSV